MKASEEELKSAELLERQELGLSHLYRTFAKKFPAYEEFWTKVSDQENTHATMIRTFRKLLEEGSFEHQVRTFDDAQIEAALNRMNEFMGVVMKGGASHEDAVNLATELELFLLDQKIFEDQPGDPPELTKVLQVLRDETRQHHAGFVEFRAKVLNAGT